MNIYRLSAHELSKSILAFFDHGQHWPNGLHSRIPACEEWALKNARALAKLVPWLFIPNFFEHWFASFSTVKGVLGLSVRESGPRWVE